MKETAGEFSMTLAVIIGAIAVVGVLGFLTSDKGPMRGWLNNQWNKLTCDNWNSSAGKCDDTP